MSDTQSIFETIKQAWEHTMKNGIHAWGIVINNLDFYKLKEECSYRLARSSVRHTIPTEDENLKIFGLHIIPCMTQPIGEIAIVDWFTGKRLLEVAEKENVND